MRSFSQILDISSMIRIWSDKLLFGADLWVNACLVLLEVILIKWVGVGILGNIDSSNRNNNR